jgi:hypothetical protein
LRPEARSGDVFAARPEGQDSESPLSWQGHSPNQAVPNRDVSADAKSALCSSAARDPSTAARRGVTGRRDLAWHWDNGRWILSCRGVLLLCVVPAGPGLWRVTDEDGRRSDLANLTWAKHGAVRAALAILNRSGTQGTAAAAPPIAGSSPADTLNLLEAKRASKAATSRSCHSADVPERRPCER